MIFYSTEEDLQNTSFKSKGLHGQQNPLRLVLYRLEFGGYLNKNCALF